MTIYAQHQMARNRSTQRKLERELVKNQEQLKKLQLEIGKPHNLFNRIEVGREYKIKVEINMTHR